MIFHSGNTQVVSAVIKAETEIIETEIKPKKEIKKKNVKKKLKSGKD